MNGRKAKMLRGRAGVNGQPVTYLDVPRPKRVLALMSSGELQNVQVVRRIRIVHPDHPRSLYQQLKRMPA